MDFLLKKARSSQVRGKEVLAAEKDIERRVPLEAEELGHVRILVQRIKSVGNENDFNVLENEVSKFIKNLKKDFDELYIIEVDIDIEEAARLHKIDKLISLLRRLNIIDPIKSLIELRDKCKLWVYQDERNEEQLEALSKSLEEKTTRIIQTEYLGPISFRIIINPNDPDLHSLYDNIYAKIPGWDPEKEFDSKEDLQWEMSNKKWSFLVAKSGNRVIGGVYFGYYVMHRWHGVIGYSGYTAVHPKFKSKDIATKLIKLSENYLRQIAKQNGYRLIMVFRFVHGKVHTSKAKQHREAAAYLNKIRAKRMDLGPNSRYVDNHDQYVRVLSEWRKRKYIPKELWLDFLAMITKDLYGTEPEDDEDYKRVKDSLKDVDKIKIEEINI